MSALIQGLVMPERGYWVRSGEYVFIAVLGGTLHPVGAFFGALAFEFLKLYAAQAPLAAVESKKYAKYVFCPRPV